MSGRFLLQGRVTPKIQVVDVDNANRHYLLSGCQITGNASGTRLVNRLALC